MMASSMLVAPPPPTSATSANAPAGSTAAPTFEFTRRKRWADLLITELSEGIILVLNFAGKILFCSHSVLELLGWRDDELIDHDIFELVHPSDSDTFRMFLANCNCDDGRELNAYARLDCKPDQLSSHALAATATRPPAVLFEFYGRPHFVPGEPNHRCIFTTAKPFPSRNTAMLNTFLELKVENTRLQSRLQTLRARASMANGMSTSADAMADRSLQVAVEGRDPTAYYAALGAVGPSHAAQSYTHATRDEDGESSQRKKRKTGAPEQHVCNTCGRTDSPEWRKGPRGPKTLCNACGLRWAKKVRKFEEGGGVGVAEPLDDVVPP